MQKKRKLALSSLVATGAAALGLILVNFVACQSRTQVDLTENQLYSLTPASRFLVSSLPDKLLIKGYFGNVPKQYAERQQYVETLLAEYAEASEGKITFDKYDPWDDEELQKELRAQGIPKLHLFTVKDNRQEQVPVYFAVQLSYLDKTELWLPSQDFGMEGLEFDISSLIQRMVKGKKKVGITTGFGEPEQTAALNHPQVGLTDLYDVVAVDWKASPEQIGDVDVLVVNGPTQPVDDKAKFYLDQHIMRGKPVLFLLAGLRWQPAPQSQQTFDPNQESPFMGMPVSHGLDEMLATYGLEVQKDVVLDPQNGVLGVIPMGHRQPLVTNLLFPLVQSPAAGPRDILPGLELLPLPFASTVKRVGPLAEGSVGAETEVRTILRSSPTAFAKDGMMVVTHETKIPTKDLPKGPFDLGYAVNGKFPSYFAQRPVPDGIVLEGDGANAGPIPESPGYTRMILVGSTEFAKDKMFEIMRMVRQPAYTNGFRALHSMVDWLAEDVSLAAVRNKSIVRPIEQPAPGTVTVLKAANVLGPPAALILFGVIYWQLRVRRRKNIRL